MKAIRRASRPLQIAVASTLLTLLASCAAPQVALPPATTAPPAAKPAPVPPPPPVKDWRDAPATPGAWRWGMDTDRSTSRFHAPDGTILAVLSCDRTARTVSLTVQSPLARAPLSISTSATARTVDAAGTPGGLKATMAATDPILDAMAFSRGRFAVEVMGRSALYLPSWPELSRVIEDCR